MNQRDCHPGRNSKIIIQELLKNDRNFFTLGQIVRLTGLPREDVRDVLIEFQLDGYLKRIRRTAIPYVKGKGPSMMNVTYRVLNPRKLAQKIEPKRRGENTIGDRMWFVIRKLGVFTRRDLRVLAGAGFETSRWFTKMLHRAGYIATSGGGEWRLIKDVGPKRPCILISLKTQDGRSDVRKGKKEKARYKKGLSFPL